MKRPHSLKLQRMSLGSHAMLIIWSAIVVFPLYIMIINSFKDRLSIYQNTFGLPEVWNFSNYTDVLKSGVMMRPNMPSRPQPSIKAASINSLGIWRMNSVSTNTAMGRPMAT